MTSSSIREQMARIIEPAAWEAVDRLRPKYADPEYRKMYDAKAKAAGVHARTWEETHARYTRHSLAKADLILALPQPPLSEKIEACIADVKSGLCCPRIHGCEQNDSEYCLVRQAFERANLIISPQPENPA